MIACVVHLPVNLNDGSAINPILREQCLTPFREITYGLTYWTVEGEWHGIVEPMQRVLVACETNQTEKFVAAVRHAGHLTGQDSMYYEIDGKPHFVELRGKLAA